MVKKLEVEALDPRKHIIIKGARLHNLKHIDVAIPRNSFTVITGVSGSGKSTLAFDTLYAEGQRRYVESLSAYARQFLARLEKPEVDYIKGISPAIAIEQKVVSSNSRSTVGTVTEIHDFLKILFARVGEIFSPKTGKPIKAQSVDDIVEELSAYEGERAIVYIQPEYLQEHTVESLLAEGYSRGRKGEEFIELSAMKSKDLVDFDLVLDRVKLQFDEDAVSSLKDSLEEGYAITEGYIWVDFYEKQGIKSLSFSSHYEEDGLTFEQPSMNLFNFNSPTGACPTCEGYGNTLGISEELVIPDVSLSVYDGAVAPWRTPANKKYRSAFIKSAAAFDFPIHKPYFELSTAQKEMLWKGTVGLKGIDAFFARKQEKIYKIQNRVLLSRYKGRTICPSCKGKKLRQEALSVKVDGKDIGEVNSMTIGDALTWITNLKLDHRQQQIAERLIDEIQSRLQFLVNVGVPYIALDRSSATLSGGESQRINLASSLGSSLVGALYVLDEPSIGLHPRDTKKLVSVLEALNKIGNTVVVVEHDADIMEASDYIIDIGPLAGTLGGELVYQGWTKDLRKSKGLTAQYLNGALQVGEIPKPKTFKKFIELKNAVKHNLKVKSVKFPLNALCAIAGVSGSGKSTLLLEELVPELKRYFNGAPAPKISGNLDLIDGLEYVDQNPIGRSSRSNPVTYIKAYDDIRTLYASQPLAKMRAYKAGVFSVNVPGGRCETCQGDGYVTVEMQFMADLHLKCSECGGKKFKEEVLEVEHQGKNISQLLEMTVEDALNLFSSVKKKDRAVEKIVEKLSALKDVGLSYVKLGQSSSTLSGGEAQRVKLAYFLIKGNTKKNTLFIFDEPTTGLHFHDVNQLLISLKALIEQGHSIIVIEHNADVIRNADHLIELGPDGGDKGGEIVFEGHPSLSEWVLRI